ncbi:hypothetical protein ABEB36_007610 [Hypothenemus hampei]|uniref:Lipase n=1 Tax=Hypothenemus hampei TaxID=57062 RepID=A0ABD1EUK2_HYPHA
METRIFVVVFLISLSPFDVFSYKINDVQLFQKFEKHLENRKTDLSDVGLDIVQYLTKYNYSVETHEVTTEDGYILSVFRIPSKNNTNNTASAPAILYLHGLLCVPIDWVTLGPDTSLALLTADQGYDVWMLGVRGTKDSMKHTTFNSSQQEFWDFSFHEKGYYDTAATIDYILKVTTLKKVTLVGHSEGTSDSMILAATRPEYNDKINLIVMLSPIAYVGGVISPLILALVKNMEALKLFFENTLHMYGLPYSDSFAEGVTNFCRSNINICIELIKELCGNDQDELDADYLLVFVSSKIGGISLKELMHYGQEIKSETFRQYDFGELGNLIHYGTTQPPDYDAAKITAPVAIYYGKNDYLAAIDDVEKLSNALPNKVDQYLVESDHFNHLDFICSRNVRTLLYDRVLGVINEKNVNN